MELIEVFKKRRSIRDYLKTPVPREMILDLLDSSTHAPVSCNLQLTQYIIVDDPDLLSRLAKEVSYKFNYTPCFIVVLQDTRFTVERLAGIMSAGMAVEHILLRAVDLGLSTCAMAGFTRDNKMRKILSIPSHMDIMLIICIGYQSDRDISSVPKIPLEKRYSINTYGNLTTLNESANLSDHSIQDIIEYRSRIAPVYLDRFRLNSYNNIYYEEVFDFFSKSILSIAKGLTILDLISYDGVFLKLLCENNINNHHKIISSDYLENNLRFFKDKFKIERLQINNQNELAGEKNSFDVVSFVFQASFTPNLEVLIENSSNALKSGGTFFITSVHESLYRKFGRSIKNLYKKVILRKTINIYENNPFYKIGPNSGLSRKDIIELCQKHHLSLAKNLHIKKSNGVTIGMYVFKKH